MTFMKKKILELKSEMDMLMAVCYLDLIEGVDPLASK